MRRRAPIDAHGGRATSNIDLQIACRVIDRSDVVPVLSPLLDAEVGRHRTISVRGLLVACQLNALARHHRAHLVQVARIINALTDEQRAELGIVRHDSEETYHRAGHRSATNSRPAGPYVGYELHLAVQARDVKWTNGINKTSLSDEVPGVVTCFSLVPAGTHRGKAIVDDLIGAKAAGEPIDDVVWDPGYSLCKPGTVHHKLAQAGIHQTFQPVTHQRGARPFSGEALLIEGQLFSSLLPNELRDLPAPPRGASEGRRRRTRRSSTCGPAGA